MSSIKEIIILGNDEHAWFASALLAFNNPWLDIVIIGEKENQMGFYGGSTRGGCQHFFNTIGFPWQELLFSASATYKLSNYYVNCGKNNRDFFHSYGAYGEDIGLLEFHQVVNALDDSCATAENYDAYSLEAQAAKHGKFIANSKSSWGLHYDRVALCQLLSVAAQKLGVRHVTEQILSIDSDHAAGIKHITTRNGDVYSADFYIDTRAAGIDSLVEESATNSSWLRRTLSDWCLTAYLAEQAVYRPVTEYRQIDSQYWLKIVPLQSRTIIELYGVGKPPSQHDHLMLFERAGVTVKTASIRLINLIPGRIKNFWSSNCLLIGRAAIAPGNLAFPILDITSFQMQKFLKLFPAITPGENLASEYNRIVAQAVDNVLDYHELQHSVLLKKNFTDKGLENLSSALTERIAFFISTGRYELHENELVSKDEWISLLMGLGVQVQQRDALISVNDLTRFSELLTSMRAEIMKSVAAMPNHLVFLSQFLQSSNKR